MFPLVYFGIHGNNPGNEKMAEQKKSALCTNTMLFILPWFEKKKKGYILTSGLKTHLRGELHSLGKYAYLKKVFEFGRKMLVI